VLLGKTTLGALAYGDIWFGGKTRNPFNPEEGSSGSSAGSASATAAGLCAFSIGTETLGSITSPSQRCGTTGLRPTFGRVSRAGGMALCWSLDKIGPICRGVEDCRAGTGGDQWRRPGRPILDPHALRLRPHRRPRRHAGSAICRPPSTIPAPPMWTARLSRPCAELGVELVEMKVPDLPYGSLFAILYAEAAAAFEELTLTNRDDELVWQDAGAWPNNFRKARFLSAVDHIQADRLRYRVMEGFDAMFRSVDAMIGPFATGPMLVATNFTGHPCLHLRAGFEELGTRSPASLGAGKLTTGEADSGGKTHRVPQGISLWGRLFDEGTILSLGLALEAKLGVAAERPPMAE
jgi:Asp-tRNA(Asn)/Glu-tRNA(Gln) amidotransferase A subunit family amidase